MRRRERVWCTQFYFSRLPIQPARLLFVVHVVQRYVVLDAPLLTAAGNADGLRLPVEVVEHGPPGVERDAPLKRRPTAEHANPNAHHVVAITARDRLRPRPRPRAPTAPLHLRLGSAVQLPSARRLSARARIHRHLRVCLYLRHLHDPMHASLENESGVHQQALNSDYETTVLIIIRMHPITHQSAPSLSPLPPPLSLSLSLSLSPPPRRSEGKKKGEKEKYFLTFYLVFLGNYVTFIFYKYKNIAFV